jgi:hypothetical protein
MLKSKKSITQTAGCVYLLFIIMKTPDYTMAKAASGTDAGDIQQAKRRRKAGARKADFGIIPADRPVES